MIILLAVVVVIPHFLNDGYIIYLNRAFANWYRVDGRWISDLTIGKWVMWVLDFLVYLSLPVCALYYYIRRGWFSWRAFDFHTDHLGRNVLSGLVLFAVVWFLALYKAVNWDPTLRELFPFWGYYAFFYKRGDGVILWLLMSIYLGLAAGFLEEFLYRSFLIRTLERIGLSSIKAAGIAVLVFTAIHFGKGAHILLLAFAVGVVFTMIYLRKRNILPLVVAHSALDIFWISGYEERFAGWLLKLV